MAETVSATGTFSHFLASLTPDQLNKLITEMISFQFPAPALPMTTAQLNGFSAPAVINAQENSGDSKVILVPQGAHLNHAAGHQRAANNRRGGRRLRATRPLNSFMAFRSYYSGIFKGLTQKVKSGLMRMLWASDAFKGKWVMLAKAYTALRGDDESEVIIPLDTFMAITVPLIGVASPDDYLAIMGFEFVANGKGSKDLVKVREPTFDKSEITTNLSVDDILTHCYNCGLGVHRAVPKFAQPGMTMSFAARPSTIRDSGSKDNALGEEEKLTDPLVIKNDTAQIAANEKVDDTHLEDHFAPALTNEVVFADQNRAFGSFGLGEFDFHFHPDAPDFLAFDPNVIQDDFDPFDVSEFIAYDG